MTVRRAQSGLTLPEVLIALVVFSAIAAASVHALRLGVDSRDQLAAADDTLKAEQIARTLIKEDFAQAVNRTVRDEFGAPIEAPFRGNLTRFGARSSDDEKLLVSFVRRGWINPQADAPRSALQYVEYVFRDGALIRRSRAYLDEAPKSDATERVLYEGLAGASAAFLLGETRGELDWADIWPVGGSRLLPMAVSISIEEEGKPALTQLFWIGEMGTAS
ncbi:MAG: type II secretion system minor pseudopilin GspJ [Parvularculaceae bacterium]